MKTKEKNELIKAIEVYLDTRDKRFMFLKMSFPSILPQINIEGSQKETANNIYQMFEKQQMLGSFMSYMNATFDTDLLLSM